MSQALRNPAFDFTMRAMKHTLIIILFVFALFISAASYAAKDMGEGYAAPTFEELSQTAVLMGGLDINDPKVADEYIRLLYCDLYQKNFKDDVAWNKVQSSTISRILEKKEYFRVQYEVENDYKFDRYNFEGQYFPFTSDTAMVNVGSIVLLDPTTYHLYCDLKTSSEYFPPAINLVLTQPLTVNKFRLPMEQVQPLLARMDEMKNTTRQVFGRIRFRVTDVPGLVIFNDTPIRSELRGEVTAVDFFLDREMTRYLGSVDLRGK